METEEIGFIYNEKGEKFPLKKVKQESLEDLKELVLQFYNISEIKNISLILNLL